MDDACLVYPLDSSHLGLSGTLRLIIAKARMPTHPRRNISRQCDSLTTIVRSDAMLPPKCQVPSIPMLTLPRYFGGIN